MEPTRNCCRCWVSWSYFLSLAIGRVTKVTGVLEAHRVTKVKEGKDKFNRVLKFYRVYQFHRVYQYLFLQVFLRVSLNKVLRVYHNLRVFIFHLVCPTTGPTSCSWRCS